MKKAMGKCRKKLILWGILGLLIAVCSVCSYIHRRVILAAVKKEPLPECPHWLPGCLKEKLGV